MIAVIDYGLGNIRSLMNWLKRGDLDVCLTDDVDVIQSAALVILPGVGAYEDAVKQLKEKGLDQVVKDVAASGQPLVGICLGMQLLYETSYEGGTYNGLGILKGEVVPFDQEKVKVPQMGWNNLISKDERFDNEFVYFVHSYYVKSDFSEVLAYCEYDVKVPAIVKERHVLGFQFHPEKSGEVGERLMILIKELMK